AYILIVTIHIKAVVYDDVVSLPLIKRVVNGAKQFFKFTIRIFKGTPTIGHVMIAYGPINGQIKCRYCINVGWKEVWGVSHYVPTINREHLTLSAIVS